MNIHLNVQMEMQPVVWKQFCMIKVYTFFTKYSFNDFTENQSTITKGDVNTP